MSKDLRKIKNAVARMEAKLDFMMKAAFPPEKLAELVLPVDEPMAGMYPIRQMNVVGTEQAPPAEPSAMPVPTGPAAEVAANTTDMSTITPPTTPVAAPKEQTTTTLVTPAPTPLVVPPPSTHPMDQYIMGYDSMTIGETLKALKDVDEEDWGAVADYEKSHKNRSQIMDALTAKKK